MTNVCSSVSVPKACSPRRLPKVSKKPKSDEVRMAGYAWYLLSLRCLLVQQVPSSAFTYTFSRIINLNHQQLGINLNNGTLANSPTSVVPLPINAVLKSVSLVNVPREHTNRAIRRHDTHHVSKCALTRNAKQKKQTCCRTRSALYKSARQHDPTSASQRDSTSA